MEWFSRSAVNSDSEERWNQLIKPHPPISRICTRASPTTANGRRFGTAPWYRLTLTAAPSGPTETNFTVHSSKPVFWKSLTGPSVTVCAVQSVRGEFCFAGQRREPFPHSVLARISQNDSTIFTTKEQGTVDATCYRTYLKSQT